MKKKLLVPGLLLLMGALSLSSCGDDPANVRNGKGFIAPNISLNADVTGVQVNGSRAVDLPTDISVEDLSLKITKTDNSYTRTWEKLSDYELTEPFQIGEYEVEAFYGTTDSEGFGNPAFCGKQTIKVNENETTPVTITAELINAMVSIHYTESFKNYMESWNSTLHSFGGNYIFFAQEENRPAYVNAGQVTLTVSFVMLSGQSASFAFNPFTAKAKFHHNLTVDLSQENGSTQLIVSFDDTLGEMEDIRIELSDEIMDSPAPTITGDGSLENNKVYSYVGGDIWTEPIKANIYAPGGFSSIVINTTSNSLFAKGWPKEIDILNCDDATKSRLRQLGFNCVGVWSTTDKMAVLDFTGMVENLGIDEDIDANSNDFTVTVTDRAGKVNETPFGFSIRTIPLLFHISTQSDIKFGQTEMVIDLNFNGTDPTKNVSFEGLNERGTWDSLITKSFLTNADKTGWKITVAVPADGKPLTIRGITNRGSISDTLVINRLVPQFNLNVDERNVWARHADISLSSDEFDDNLLSANATLYMSANDNPYIKVEGPENENNIFSIYSLAPATKYSIKATVNGNAEDCCEPIVFTTESATNVPNGNFDTVGVTLSETGIEQGGKWSVSSGINYQNTAKYTISTPTGWATVNKKTTCSTTRNTWFVVPSTFNSSLSWISTVPPIKVINTGGGSETPQSYSGFEAKSGANAMVIRNVAWDPAGTVPGVWKKQFASEDDYYNHTVPEISRVSAGKLYLGGPYSYDASTGTETYKQGVAFTSRPTRLNGYYRYIPDQQDPSEQGTVTIELYNGDEKIASGNAFLGKAENYTAFNVPLTYKANAPKATSLRIMFTSSDKKNEADIKVSTFNYRYESAKHGATLVVDNLTFTY